MIQEIQILKSTSGNAEGPYVSALNPDQPISRDIDASLFMDDDGKVYSVIGNAERTGTKKSYISRIERGKSDIQISTYYKLIEIGLGKQLNISIG